MAPSDVVVRMVLEDHVSPVLRALSRRLWFYKHGTHVILALVIAVFVLAVVFAFVLGRVTA